MAGPPSTNSSVSQAPATQPGRSIFPSTPSFSLDTFSSRDFIVKDFVEALSDSAIPANRRSGPSQQADAFDPKPLIRTFEHALKRMSDLSGDLEIQENERSAAVRRAEAQHNQNVQILGRKLDQTIDSFHALDTSLNGDDYDSGGNNVVKIGESLEELDRYMTRAQDARFIIQCWMEVSERGELFQLEDIRRSGDGEGKVRCARIARILAKISQRLDPESWSTVHGQGKQVNGVNGVNGAKSDRKRRRPNTREIIEKFSETLEKDLLKSFQDFYRRQNFGGMRDCANVLHDFSGGASVVALFVNQHQFFIERSQLITEEVSGDAKTWDPLADPDAELPGVEPSLQSLIDEVKGVVQDESIIIKNAFPFSEEVLTKFLQRVFQQSIQQRLEMVLEKASTVSSLAFLRSLQAARSYISALVDDLKAHGLTEHPEPVSSQIGMVLDQQFDDLFVPYFVGASYIEREKRSLEELYASLLFKFTIFHSRRRKVPTTFMKSLAKSGSEILSSARDAYVERLDSSDLAPAQKAMLLRVAGLKDSENAKTQTEIEVSEQDGVLSTANAKRMLKWLAEAVGRGLELSGGSETTKDVSSLLNLLLTNMGEIYLETSLDAANDIVTSQENPKNEPDLAYLQNMRSAITIMHLMNTFIRTVLIPLATSNITTSRQMEKITAQSLERMEEKISSIMQKTIDVVLAWVTKLLARQLKTDYRPKDDTLSGASDWLEQLQTPTCLSIFTFLGRLHTLAISALGPSSNLTAFLTELAVNVRSLLLEHFKKFAVNAAGGIMVTKDITKYIELLRSWEVDDSFLPSLEVLAEVGHLFVIGPEALRERLRGTKGMAGPGGGLWDRNDMRAYVLKREDAGSGFVTTSTKFRIPCPPHHQTRTVFSEPTKAASQEYKNGISYMMDGDTFTLKTSTPKLDTAEQILPHLTPLASSNTVTTINLSGNTLGAPACTALANILSTKTTLRTANFADIFTSRLLSEIPPALSSLLTSLLPLQNLHTVDLSDNAFGLNTQAPLVEFLSQHVPLKHLILNNNGLGPNAGTLIADALTTLAEKKEEARRKQHGTGPEVPDLETIVCGRNRLESGSMGAWAKCFQAHRGVKVVKMVQNGIRQDGIALLLREGLGRCEGLEVCDLQDNTFTSIGARALAEVVGGWERLKELGVGDCLVGARGMVSVAEALGGGKNAELRVLRAQYNEIDVKGVGALLKVVKAGKLEGLRRVELNGNKFNEDDESVEGLRLLLEERKEKSQEADEGEWGIDELSDLEEDSDDEEDESEEQAEEEEEEREGKAEKLLEEADQEENKTVSQKKDADVDELADQLGKTELK